MLVPTYQDEDIMPEDIDSNFLSDGEPNSDTIKVTAAAIENALRIWNQYENFDSLRIYLDGKGCDGFFYGVSFDNKTPEDQIICNIGDSSLQLVIDPATKVFIEGSELGWVDDERGTGFWVDNPRHSKYRGKFFKRETWKKKLTKSRPELN